MTERLLSNKSEGRVALLASSLVTLAISLLGALGLPFAFLVLWRKAANDSPIQSDYVYFPATTAEFVWLGAFILSALPFVATTLLLLLPMRFILTGLGLQGNIHLPFVVGPAGVDSAVFIAGLFGLIAQVLLWWSMTSLILSGLLTMTSAPRRPDFSRGFTLRYLSRRRRARRQRRRRG